MFKPRVIEGGKRSVSRDFWRYTMRPENGVQKAYLVPVDAKSELVVDLEKKLSEDPWVSKSRMTAGGFILSSPKEYVAEVLQHAVDFGLSMRHDLIAPPFPGIHELTFSVSNENCASNVANSKQAIAIKGNRMVAGKPDEVLFDCVSFALARYRPY